MIKKSLIFLALTIVVFNSYGSVVSAMTQSDLKAILNNIPYYEPVDTCSVASTGATSVEGGTTEENKKVIWQYLTGKGLTAEQTAGLMGNLQAEGGFEPRRTEYAFSDPPYLSDDVPADKNDKGQPGYGIVQWTWPTRKQALRDFSKERGIKAGDLGLQLDFLWKELTGGYKEKIYEPLQKSTTIEEASKIIVTRFERPLNYETQEVQDKRAGFGNAIYKQFVGTDPGTIATSGSSCGQVRSTPTNGRFIYYAQDGPEYGGINIPGSNTIAYSGCGITSFAMAIANLVDPSVTPKTIVDNLTDYPQTQRGIWLVQKLGSQFGVKGTVLNNIDEVISSLKQGNYVITGGQGSNGTFNESGDGHIVLLTGIDSDNNITVANPLGSFKDKTKYTANQVSNWATYYMEISK